MFNHSTKNNQPNQKSGTSLGSLGLSLCVAFYLCLFCLASPVHAAVTTTGDVDPADPTTWGTNTEAYIGKTGNGTLSITEGSDVISRNGRIGHDSDSTGEVTVDGSNSTWVNKYSIYVGDHGSGTLNITNGGEVTARRDSWVARGSGSTGIVTVDGNGSHLLEHQSALYIGGEGNGVMNITGGGKVSSGEGYISYYHGSTSEVTVDGIGSAWNISGGLGSLAVGFRSNGTLSITNGGLVSSRSGGVGPAGKAKIDRIGSKWIIEEDIYIGSDMFSITGGGEVSNKTGYIGENQKMGKVQVDGTGSIWMNSELYVGDRGFSYDGHGMLNITNEGLVVSKVLAIDKNEDRGSFINMASGGMLALMGDADNSLREFLDLVEGTDAIRYWDDYALDWEHITWAFSGEDYTLRLGEGDLAGYTVLTVLAEVTILGDINGDGVVDGFDVDPFVAELLTDGYYNPLADINRDGTVNGFDVDPFVALVIGGGDGPQRTEIPEPATLVLLGLGGLIYGRRHYG